MSTVEPDDPRIPSRPLWGLAILSLPILGIFVVFTGYAVMWWLGLAGRSATGEPVTMAFQGCAEARPFMEARMVEMGLDGVWEAGPSGFSVTAQLTGDEEVDAGLPAVLASVGALEIRGGDQVLATHADVRDATVRMDLFMVPYVLFHLEDPAAQRIRENVREDPGGKLEFFVDGAKVGWQSNQNPLPVGHLEMNPEISEEQERMRAVANWAVTLDHGPLPCPVTPL